MHAANKANEPKDIRHKLFEDAADGYTLSSKSLGNFDLGQWRSPGQLVHELAVRSKRVYMNEVKTLLETKGGWDGFTLDEITPVMKKVEEYALTLTAQFILCVEIGRVGGTVHSIYQRLLKRPADPSGLKNWGDMLVAGSTIKDVMNGVIRSDEFVNTIAGNAKNDIAAGTRALYDRIFARTASEDEIKEWNGWMKDGRYYDSAKFMLDSEEYEQRFGQHIVPY